MHRLRLSRLFEVGAVARKHLFRNPRGVALLAAADFVVLRLVERKADFFRRVGEELFGGRLQLHRVTHEESVRPFGAVRGRGRVEARG